MLILLCFSVVLGWAGFQQIKPSEKTCLVWHICFWVTVFVVPAVEVTTDLDALVCGVLAWSSLAEDHWPAQCEAGLWLGCCPHALMLLYPVGQEGKCPTATVPVPQLPKKSVSCVVSVHVGQPDCSQDFWMDFNLWGNVWNTTFALKGVLSNCFSLLIERINHSPFSSFLVFLLFIK